MFVTLKDIKENFDDLTSDDDIALQLESCDTKYLASYSNSIAMPCNIDEIVEKIRQDRSSIIYGDPNKGNLICKFQDKLAIKLLENNTRWGLSHETLVSDILSKLNNPNFLKILAYCNGPLPKSLITAKYKTCDYVIYERIEGITLKSFCVKVVKGKFQELFEQNFIPTPSLEACNSQLKSILDQILLALLDANEAFDFVHCDLHCKNVLITPKKQIIRYKSRILDVSVVAKIIDFGLATITYDNRKYGSAIIGDISLLSIPWISDITKLLLTTIGEISDSSPILNRKRVDTIVSIFCHILSPISFEQTPVKNFENILVLAEKLSYSYKLVPPKSVTKSIEFREFVRLIVKF